MGGKADIVEQALKLIFSGSKAVNESGIPTRVYHGTTHDLPIIKPGSYFTEDPSEASAYTFWTDLANADKRRDRYSIITAPEMAGKRLKYSGIPGDIEFPEVGQFYATDNGIMQYNGKGRWKIASDVGADYNSFDPSDYTIGVKPHDRLKYAQEMVDEHEEAIKSVYPGGVGGNVIPAYLNIKNPKEMSPLEGNRFGERLGADPKWVANEIEKLKSQGYDSIVTTSDDLFYRVNPQKPPKQYIIFEPTQVKSAVGNSGEYDFTNPDITKAEGGRIAKGGGGLIDDAVRLAGKLISGEGEQAAKPAIRYAAESSEKLTPNFKVQLAPGADEESRRLVDYLSKRDPNLTYDPKSLEERRKDLGMTVDAFHGSPRNIERFSNQYSSPEGYWGGHHYFTSSPLDASANYATPSGPDLNNRIEREAESVLDNYSDEDVLNWYEGKHGSSEGVDPENIDVLNDYSRDIARDVLGITNEGAVYPVNLRMKNPVRIDSPNQTFWDYNVDFSDDGDVLSESGRAIDLINNTRDVLSEYNLRPRDIEDVIGKLGEAMSDSGGIDAKTYNDIIRGQHIDAYDDNGKLVSGGHIMADVFQRMGHDSVDMPTDVFAGGIGRVGMPGTGGNTRHYIIFDPKNVRSRFGAFDPFKAASDRISDARGGSVESNINNALRLARDVGGATNENPQVFLTDAQGRQYDAQGNPIQPAQTQAQSNSAATDAAPTPEQVGRRAADDPATFDALMQKYAIPDRDIAEYEALQAAVRQQPQEVQQMTHVGAPPMRDVKVDMPLFGGEYSVGQAPYNVANPMSGVAQTAYDLKTVPLYFTPWTAPIGASLDVAEGVATGDPTTASLAIAFGPGSRVAKAAGIGAANYFIDPSEAEAGPARWFSKAMEVAREIPMNKMTGEQALAMLRKGTSPEELRWTGTDVFLQGKPTVTKDELVDYLNKNRVQVGEIRLGGEKPKQINYLDQVDKDILDRYEPKFQAAQAEHKAALDRFYPALGTENEEAAWSAVQDAKRVETELQIAAMQEMKDRVGAYLPTKYEDYSTAGGEGYAETLYTLGRSKKPKVEQRNRMFYLVDENGNTLRNQSGGEYSYYSENDANRAAASIHRGSGSYQSSHWSEPDVLAHSRSQTLMYEPPGANRPYRVHNVDETQSDWGQDARKKGVYNPQVYKNWERDTKNTKEAIRDLSDMLSMRAEEIEQSLGPKPTRWRGEEFTNYHERRQAAIDNDPKIQEMRKQIEDYRFKLMQLDENKPNISGVPAAPYVSSTEGWTDLAIKKQLDNALDSNADYFSWTPGQAHADRYDLRRHIGSVVYDPYYERFKAYDPNGRHLVEEDMRDASRIDEYVGKELADKIRAMSAKRKSDFYEGITLEENPNTGKWDIVKNGKPIILYSQKATDFPSKAYAAEFLDDAFGDTLRDNPIKLEGIDLKTGGEGMIGYYDKVYLKRVQEVIKKATGTKPEIEVIEVQTADGPRKQLGVKLTDEMREKARFSDFNKGGRVTGGNTYDNDPSIAHALALTSEY